MSEIAPTTAPSNDIGKLSSTQQFLTFTIGEAEYGVDIMSVREVKGWVPTTRLPNRPEYIRGVLNLRGLIVPIFDLRARFGQGLTDATEKHVMVILAVGSRIAGLLVDAVSDILTVGDAEIKPAPQGEVDAAAQFVSGLIAVEQRMVVLLDMSKLFNTEADAAVLAESAATQH
jgi:purine-binding chemotaxis protein CheW